MEIKSLVGDRSFYKHVIAVAAPLVLQQLITTSVQLVDNLMVGSLGQPAMNSVSIVNQLYFIVILITFGAMGGAGVFSAQYFGSKNFEKLKQTFRFKIIIGFIIAFTSFIIFTFFGESLLGLFTDDPITVKGGLQYLNIAKWKEKKLLKRNVRPRGLK